MAYSTKNVIGEVALINIIRILYVGVCISFFLPMFKGEVIYLDIDELAESAILTGFNTIFGAGNNISGSPFALIAFMFPAVAIIATLIDFLYDRLHIVCYIMGAIGIISTIVYTVAEMIMLNSSLTIFGITIKEANGSLSWGILVPIGLYAVSVVLAFLYKKVAD